MAEAHGTSLSTRIGKVGQETMSPEGSPRKRVTFTLSPRSNHSEVSQVSVSRSWVAEETEKGYGQTQSGLPKVLINEDSLVAPVPDASSCIMQEKVQTLAGKLVMQSLLSASL